MSRPIGSKNKEKAAFESAWRRCAKRHGVHENEVLAELMKDESAGIRLGAVKLVIFMLHAKPATLPIMPIASDAQLTFLPAEPTPDGNRYDGETLQ